MTFLYLKPFNKLILWNIVNKDNDIADFITDENGFNDIIDTLRDISKNDEIVTNYNIIKTKALDLNVTIDKSIVFPEEKFLKMTERLIYSHPDVPDFINVKLKDIESENKFQTNINIALKLLQIYSYFNDNPDKMFDFPLYQDLINNGYIEKHETAEDLLEYITGGLN